MSRPRTPWWFERVLARLFGTRFKQRHAGTIIRHWRGEFYLLKPVRPSTWAGAVFWIMCMSLLGFVTGWRPF